MPPPPADAPPKSNYTVVARRYRPQQFSDLIGQEHVALALTNAIQSGRIAHAFLFTGARGVGKTSTARILAKALNCDRGPTATPCDKCDNCVGIMAGDDVDVIEIDGASNNGVENIRELRANAGFRPQRGRFKVYIVDEVHMFSNSAFNALLKTLEEPPAHVKFILATTEVQKIPVTILSRCQRFDFATVGPAKVFETLRHIVRKEGLKADDDALHAVSRRAAGSMRDAQTLLDQLLGYADGNLTAEKMRALLGTAGDERVGDLAAAILGHDAAKAVALIGRAADEGLQLGELLDQLVDYWRGMMLVQVAGDGARDLPGTPTLQAQIRDAAGRTTLDGTLAGIDILTATKGKLRASSHVQVLLEVAVVRLSRIEELLAVSTLVRMLAGAPTEAALPVAAAAVPQAVAKTAAAVPKVEAVPPEAVKKNSVAPTVPAARVELTPAVPIPSGLSVPPPTVVAKPKEFAVVWREVLDGVGQVRREQLKSAGLPAILGPNSLAIRFPADYSSAYESCRTDATQEILRNLLRKLTGDEWVVRVELLAAAAKPPMPLPNGSANGHGLPTAFSPSGGPVERTRSLMQLPLFAKAAEALGAQLLRVDDGFNPHAVAEEPVAVPDLVAAAAVDAAVPEPE